MENHTKDEFEINSSLFGGYNKKQMDAYVMELQGMIEGLQEEVEEVRSEKDELTQKLAKSEACYKSLWERSKGQEETVNAQEELIHQLKEERKDREAIMKAQADLIRDQKVVLKGQMQVLKNQEVMMKGQGELIKNQESLLKGQDELIKSQEAMLRDLSEQAKGQEVLVKGQGELSGSQARVLKGMDALADRESVERLERKADKLGRSLEKLEQKGNLLPVNTLDSLIKKQIKRVGKKRIN